MALSAFGVVFIGGATLLVLAVGLTSASWGGWPLTATMLGVALVMGFFTLYVGRDMLGKWPWRIEIEPEALTLDLPAARSLIHNPPACHETVPVADIAAIETRLEAYKGWIGSMMQRSYRLVLKDKPAIFLFEDRALGTALANGSLYPVVEDISLRTGLPLKDLGMTQGVNGLLGVLFVRAPDWGAAALTPVEQAKTWGRVRLTGALALVALVVVIVLVVFV